MPRFPRVVGFGFRFTYGLTGSVVLAFLVGAVWVLVVGFFAVSALLLAWPLLIAAAASYWLASLRGWPPRRLLVIAAWSLPMLAVFIGTFGLMSMTAPGADPGERWAGFAIAPLVAVFRARAAFENGLVLHGAVYMAPVAIPVGLFIGWLAWRSRIALMESGLAGWSPAAPMAFDYKQWRRAARTARERVRAPGGVPLVSRRGNPILGAVIRTVGFLPRPVLELGYGSLRNHMLIVGTTGSGKTTLLLRLWAGFWDAATRLHLKRREWRPWLVVIDAKGGFASRDTADRVRRVMTDQGASRVGVWPDEVALNLWALPPGKLVDVLVDLVPVASDGAAAYYADVLAATVDLAVHAPAGPPANSHDFLSRLDQVWLELAYAGIAERQADVRSAGKHVPDVRLRYKTLMSRLGPGFDGDHAVTDFDVLYCVVEGTAGITVAEAQARALVELITDAATRWGRTNEVGQEGNVVEQRAGLLALDEFSAVAGKVRIYELTERARSLGLAVQVTAQSWEGLAPTEDERRRIAATSAGGTFVMRSPDPQRLCELAGTRFVIEVGKKLVGDGYGDEGTGRVQHAWVVDPDRVRNFDVGQAAFIYGNAATYLHVAPVQPAPRALAKTRVTDPPEHPPPAHLSVPEQTEPKQPTHSRPAGLDDVFGGGGPR